MLQSMGQPSIAQSVSSAPVKKPWARDPVAILFPWKGELTAAAGHSMEPQSRPSQWKAEPEGGGKPRSGGIMGALDPTVPEVSLLLNFSILWPISDPLG